MRGRSTAPYEPHLTHFDKPGIAIPGRCPEMAVARYPNEVKGYRARIRYSSQHCQLSAQILLKEKALLRRAFKKTGA